MGRPRVPLLSRERIRDAALTIIDRGGLSELSMRRLAAELGVQAASLYKHYPNKDDVLDDIARGVIGRVDTSASTRARTGRRPWRRGPVPIARRSRRTRIWCRISPRGRVNARRTTRRQRRARWPSPRRLAAARGDADRRRNAASGHGIHRGLVFTRVRRRRPGLPRPLPAPRTGTSAAQQGRRDRHCQLRVGTVGIHRRVAGPLRGHR